LVKNPLLKYSIERLLNEANPEGGTFFGDTAFNKMIFLLYRRLQENDVDIKLPYYWYLQGSLIEEKQFESEVGKSRLYYITSDHSSRRMPSVPNTPIADGEKRIIDQNIQTLVQHYKQANGYFKKGYLDLLLDDVYEKAPYEFQRVFNRKFVPFLNSFKTPVQRKVPASLSFTDENIDNIETFLDQSLRVFPAEDMERIFETYLEWDDTARIAIEYDQKRIFPMTDSFWKMFCKNLRVIKNENIPDELIHEWDVLFTTAVFPEYQGTLYKLRKSLLKKWKTGQGEDTEIDNLVKKLNFISRNNLSKTEN
jgi:hypothetical protein